MYYMHLKLVLCWTLLLFVFLSVNIIINIYETNFHQNALEIIALLICNSTDKILLKNILNCASKTGILKMMELLLTRHFWWFRSANIWRRLAFKPGLSCNLLFLWTLNKYAWCDKVSINTLLHMPLQCPFRSPTYARRFHVAITNLLPGNFVSGTSEIADIS